MYVTENQASADPNSLNRRPNVLLDGRLIRLLIPVLLVLVALTMVSLHVHMYTKGGAYR